MFNKLKKKIQAWSMTSSQAKNLAIFDISRQRLVSFKHYSFVS